MLAELAGSRTAPARAVESGYADGWSISEVMRRVGVGRPMIYKCIDKVLAAGVAAGLKDACHHRPHEPKITDEAKAWVVSVACTKPKDHGLAAELWFISALAKGVSEHAEGAGHPRLAQAGKSTVWRILNEHQSKPHKIRDYLERCDREVDRKRQEVLIGHIFAHTEDRHRSVEFIELLKGIDAYYPPEAIIRVALDRHAVHIVFSERTTGFATVASLSLCLTCRMFQSAFAILLRKETP